MTLWGLTLGQFVAEGLDFMEGTHTGAVCELQFIGRTHAEVVCS